MTLITSSLARRQASVSSVLANSHVRAGGVQRQRIEASSPEPRQFPFRLPDGTIYVQLYGEEPNWLYSALNKLQTLATMPENWDSHGGSAITAEAIFATLKFMAQYLSDRTKEPSIVPTSAGGLQLEWHRMVGDLEVSFTADGAIAAYFASTTSGEEWEMELGSINSQRLAAAVDSVAAESSN